MTHSSEQTKSSLEEWLKKMDHALDHEVNAEFPPKLIYRCQLSRYHHTHWVSVDVLVVARLKRGGYGKAVEFLEQIPAHAALQTEDDIYIYDALKKIRDQYHLAPFPHFLLLGSTAETIWEEMLSTGRTYWVAMDTAPLQSGAPKEGKLYWQTWDDGKQQLYCRISGSNALALPLESGCYLDLGTHTTGSLMTGFHPRVMKEFMQTLAFSETHLIAPKKEAKEIALSTKISIARHQIKPQPYLRLLGLPSVQKERGNFILPCVEIYFRYGPYHVSVADPVDVMLSKIGPTLIEWQRNKEQEQEYREQFLSQCEFLMPLENNPTYLNKQSLGDFHCFDDSASFDAEKIIHFLSQMIPQLKTQGFDVIEESSFPLKVLDSENHWYSEIDDRQGHGWFDWEFGIESEEGKINILPLLAEWGQHQRFVDGKKNYIELSEGKYLALSETRVQQILSILNELQHRDALKNDRLHLSYLRAADILMFEQAVGACQMRWLGTQRLKTLAEKLTQFKGIQEIPIPVDFQATLRPYQQHGLNWLQFLREFDLAGILADDMGLGKTVQTLAYLSVEKESGRMNVPSLIVSPTSLVMNWYQEAKRFAPTLNVLVLQGQGRKRHLDSFQEYDVVISTYPLLIRDYKIYLKNMFYCLILDEAQIIKNAKAKSTQILLQIEAKHRLCLTGTPLENNLAELWSLFNFLLPGLLGEYKSFRKYYQMPIEKMQDIQRRDQLIKRVSPFLLRRTKEQVATELPPKTEIIRTVSLEGKQRDLYETIRLAMQARVLEAIENKGFQNSRIIILDALLKLRQTCCDPRLLKLKVAENVVESAKLELLLTLLPNLIAEGRSVLLFSSFTTMLQIIENELPKYDIPYVKLTGKTKDRQTPIQQFQAGEVPLFLISLKAGGLGLNLTRADTVIHYDPWWNPAAELQATDRAHRIGQDKPIFVYKLITNDTVEEKIVALQQKKQSLIDSLFSPQKEIMTITADDLMHLFEKLDS